MQFKERHYLLPVHISGDFRPYQNRDVTLREVGEQVTIYNPQTEQTHMLNATAASIWNLCNGCRNTQDIVGQVAFSRGMAPEVVAQDVVEALEHFRQTQLVLL